MNISGKGNDGTGLPFVQFYRNIDIVQAYDPKSLKEENKKFLGITMPDFTKLTAAQIAGLTELIKDLNSDGVLDLVKKLSDVVTKAAANSDEITNNQDRLVELEAKAHVKYTDIEAVNSSVVDIKLELGSVKTLSIVAKQKAYLG